MDGKIGPRIRELRVTRRLTQKNLALLSGLSQQHLSRLEQGRGGVELTTLLKVLDALGHELTFTPRSSAPAAELAARARQWDRVAAWEAAQERQAPGGGALARAGALADFFLSRHAAQPSPSELRAHALGVRAWRGLLAYVKPAAP